jgi:hypothetical protein
MLFSFDYFQNFPGEISLMAGYQILLVQFLLSIEFVRSTEMAVLSFDRTLMIHDGYYYKRM